jgi:hypothetical protein
MNKPLALVIFSVLLFGTGCRLSVLDRLAVEPAPMETPSTGGDRKMAYSAYVLTQIKEQSALPFGDIQATNITWNAEAGESPVSGYEMRVETNGDSNEGEAVIAIEDLLKTEGYALDGYNTSDGTVVGSRGYMKENEVCRIFLQSTLETGAESVRIVCGTKQ